MDAYLHAAGIAGDKKGPISRTGALTENRMSRVDALKVIKRRARAVGLPAAISCHTFRATGITAYLENGGTIEDAQAIAAHESPRTTKLYDRTSDELCSSPYLTASQLWEMYHRGDPYVFKGRHAF
jgi:integrase